MRFAKDGLPFFEAVGGVWAPGIVDAVGGPDERVRRKTEEMQRPALAA